MAFRSASRTPASLGAARNQLEAMRSRFAAVRRAGAAAPKQEIMSVAETVGGGALGGFLEAKFGDKFKIGPVGPAGLAGVVLGALAFFAPKKIRCHVLDVGSGSLAYAVGAMVKDAAD